MSQTIRAAVVLIVVLASFLGILLFRGSGSSPSKDYRDPSQHQGEPQLKSQLSGSNQQTATQSDSKHTTEAKVRETESKTIVEIRVTDEFNRAMAAEVLIQGHFQARAVELGVSGFCSEALPVGLATFEVRASGYAVERLVRKLQKDAKTSLEVQLKPLAACLLQIVDTEDQPVAGVSVQVNSMNSRTDANEQVTDNLGQIKLAALNPGFQRLQLAKEGYWPSQKPILLLPGQELQKSIQIHAVTKIRGRVSSRTQTAVMLEVQVGRQVVRQNCDADGQFCFEVPCGSAIITATDRSRQLFASQQLQLTQPFRDFIELTLQPGFAIEGQVLTAKGEGVANCPVTIEAAEKSFRWHTSTDKAGHFISPKLARGSYAIQAQYDDLAAGKTTKQLQLDGPTQVELTIPELGSSTLKFVDPMNQALESCRVRAYQEGKLVCEAKTDRDGCILLKAKPALPVHFILEKSAPLSFFFQTIQEIERNSENVTKVQVSSAVELTIEVRDEQGQALTKAPVKLQKNDSVAKLPPLSLRCNDSGRCRVHVPVGNYKLSIDANDWPRFQLQFGRVLSKPAAQVIDHQGPQSVILRCHGQTK